MNDFIPLTYVYSTAVSAHKVLEQIVETKCMLAKSSRYGLSGEYVTLFRVAKPPDTHFLMQAEIKAIKQGLIYYEEENNRYSYKGYFN